MDYRLRLRDGTNQSLLSILADYLLGTVSSPASPELPMHRILSAQHPRLNRHFSFIRYLFASAASSLDCSVVSTPTVSGPVGRRSPPPPRDTARDMPRRYQGSCMYAQHLPPRRARRPCRVPVRPPAGTPPTPGHDTQRADGPAAWQRAGSGGCDSGHAHARRNAEAHRSRAEEVLRLQHDRYELVTEEQP
jgi:hypothetical protein